MRELKFRAWDEAAGRFRTDITIRDGIAESSWGKEKPEWIIEQFTGLLDKNGKMIFEGDVLKSTRAYRYLYEADYIGEIKHREHFADYEYGVVGGQITQTKAKYCEVIGTIHDAEYKELAK